MTTNPNTIFALLTKGVALLKHANGDVHFHAPRDPHFDAQLLLSNVLRVSRAHVLTHGDATVNEEDVQTFLAYIARRAQNEPIAYILGEKAFFGRDFLVTRDTLIPRPETELFLETLLPTVTDRTVIVDVGTGSGALAVSFAKETPAPVYAIDISHKALEIAKKNAQRHNASERMTFLEGNLLLPFFPALHHLTQRFSLDTLLICANLPYLSEHQWETLDTNVKDHEPKRALVGGKHGDELYDELCMQLVAKRSTLPEQTILACEIDPSQKEHVPRRIKQHFPYADIIRFHDIAGLPRLIVATLFPPQTKKAP